MNGLDTLIKGIKPYKEASDIIMFAMNRKNAYGDCLVHFKDYDIKGYDGEFVAVAFYNGNYDMLEFERDWYEGQKNLYIIGYVLIRDINVEHEDWYVNL